MSGSHRWDSISTFYRHRHGIYNIGDQLLGLTAAQLRLRGDH
jgi:hypothetical protein